MNTKLHDVSGAGFGPSNLAPSLAAQKFWQANGKALDRIFLNEREHRRSLYAALDLTGRHRETKVCAHASA